MQHNVKNEIDTRDIAFLSQRNIFSLIASNLDKVSLLNLSNTCRAARQKYYMFQFINPIELMKLLSTFNSKQWNKFIKSFPDQYKIELLKQSNQSIAAFVCYLLLGDLANLTIENVNYNQINDYMEKVQSSDLLKTGVRIMLFVLFWQFSEKHEIELNTFLQLEFCPRNHELGINQLHALDFLRSRVNYELTKCNYQDYDKSIRQLESLIEILNVARYSKMFTADLTILGREFGGRH